MLWEQVGQAESFQCVVAVFHVKALCVHSTCLSKIGSDENKMDEGSPAS